VHRVSKVVALLALACLLAVVGTQATMSGAQSLAGLSSARERGQIIQDVYMLILQRSLANVQPDDLIRGALRGMVEALDDPYSMFQDPESFRNFQGDIEGEFGGVGMYITIKDGRLTVIAPIQDSPAAAAGIQPGDRITGIDGLPTEGMSSQEAAQLLRGTEGTAVWVTVEREGLSSPLELKLVRGHIVVTSVSFRMLEADVGYLSISKFTDRTPSEFAQALDALRAKGMRALVLDLRNDPGGLLDAAVDVASHLVPEGPVVYSMTRGGDRRAYYSETPDLGLPLAVLVNEGTASAAEIVAGAVQDYQTGFLVGTSTFGKGTVQSLLPLMPWGGIRLTVAEYRTPVGRSLRDQGLEPNYEVGASGGRGPAMNDPEWWAERLQPTGRPLRPGVVGLDVLVLQEFLTARGFDPGAADGIFGPRTAAALLRFQRDQGLAQSGVLDTATRRAVTSLIQPQPGMTDGEDRQLQRALELLRSRMDG